MNFNIEWDYGRWSVRVSGVFQGEEYVAYYEYGKSVTLEFVYNEIIKDLLRHLQLGEIENDIEQI